MALSGSASVAVTSYNTLTFSWSASQSVSGNYSDISWSMVLKSTKYGAISSSTSKSWSVWIGNNHYTGSNTVGIGANSSKTLASGKTRVTHSSAGEASFSYSFSQTFNINFNGWVGTKSGSGSATLNTIPRASSLSAPAINFGETGTFTISRASSGFTHTITAKFGTSNYSATIATKTSATSVKWTLPLEWANGIPNSQTGTMTYTIQTYSGSTLIGTQTTTGTVKVLQEDAFPMFEGVDILDANSDIVNKFGEFVQSKSIVQADGSYHGQYGATIKQTFVEVEGKRYTSTSNISQATVPIAGSGALTVGYGCVDSRGFENKQTKTIQVTPYTALTLTEFSAFRCDASGEAEDEGTRLNCKREFSISPISNKNTNTWKIEARKSGETSWTQIGNGTGYSINDNYITSDFFDVDYPYEVQLTIADYFATVSKIIEIPTAFTLVDYNTNGDSIAFGGVSTREAGEKIADFKLEIYDKFNTRIGNGLARYTGSADKAIDPDTTLEELILTDKNTPWTGFAYVRTMFYGSKSVTSARTQIAYPYTNGRIAQRIFKNGAWGAWEIYSHSQADFVVQQGVSGYWTYRKWSSGIAECWGEIPSGSKSLQVTFWVNLPFSFSNINYIPTITPANNGSIITKSGDWNALGNQQHQASRFALTYTATSAYEPTFNIQVNGRWQG